jgi:hypothetical protein
MHERINHHGGWPCQTQGHHFHGLSKVQDHSQLKKTILKDASKKMRRTKKACFSFLDFSHVGSNKTPS